MNYNVCMMAACELSPVLEQAEDLELAGREAAGASTGWKLWLTRGPTCNI